MGTRVTVGRIVHVYSSEWTGPRPGIVVNCWSEAEATIDSPINANMNVFLDGGNDATVLEKKRASRAWPTLMSIPVFEARTPEQRESWAAVSPHSTCFAEFPPRV